MNGLHSPFRSLRGSHRTLVSLKGTINPRIQFIELLKADSIDQARMDHWQCHIAAVQNL